MKREHAEARSNDEIELDGDTAETARMGDEEGQEGSIEGGRSDDSGRARVVFVG